MEKIAFAELQEELLDQLYDTLVHLIREYQHIQKRMARGDYTADEARHDHALLAQIEALDPMALLTKIVNLNAGEGL